MRDIQHFIGGSAVAGASGRFGDVFNPNTGEVQARVALATEAELDRAVKAADILRATQSVDRKLITNVTVFDVYEGKGIEPGKKSVAIAVTLQPREKTMTDEEIDAVAAKIVAEVGKRTGGALRA